MVEEVEAAWLAVVLVAQLAVLVALVVLAALAAQVVVPVGQVVLEEVDLVQVSTWEEIPVVAEQMEDSRATCLLCSTGTAQKVTNFCGNSAF